MTDGDGDVIAYNDYDPFGNPVTTLGSDSSFGFTGEQEDESGLLFLRARYYNAETGRFINQDSWKGEQFNPQTLHLYGYTTNNPLNATDPSGQSSCMMAPAVDGAGRISGSVYYPSVNCPTYMRPGGIERGGNGGGLFGLGVGALIGMAVAEGTYSSSIEFAPFRPQVVPAPTPRPMIPAPATPGTEVYNPSRIIPMVAAPQPNQSPDDDPNPTPEPSPQPEVDFFPAPTAICTDEDDEIPQVLYHYTETRFVKDILDSKVIWASLGEHGDAQWGDGQYFTDISPSDASKFSAWQLSRALYTTPWKTNKVSSWLAIDVTGLPVLRVSPVFSRTYGNKYIYLIPNVDDLSIATRVRATGITQFTNKP